MGLLILLFVFGFVVGVVSVIAAEALGVLVLINKLSKRIQKYEAITNDPRLEESNLDPLQSLNFLSEKQGLVWILESDGREDLERPPREQKKRKDFLEASPVRKHAKVKDQSLILIDSDGSKKTYCLKGCTVVAVSATSSPSRKWAKRYPIKLEAKTSEIFDGNKVFYIYLETSWEKESWCKALRLASHVDEERLAWFAKLHKEFHGYLLSLNIGYPSFTKPSSGFFAEPLDKENKLEAYSSKVRLLWKKIAKKTSKAGLDSKVNSSASGREERKASDRFLPSQDSVCSNGLEKAAPTMKRIKSSADGKMVPPPSASLTHSVSQSHNYALADADHDEKFGFDEGTLCWNLLISRFFFDAKNNEEMKRSLHKRIQRTLSNMRTPTYIGEIICSKIDPGILPPYIHAMRVPPLELNEVWSIEIDLEYSGGIVLDIETRLEVRELDLLQSVVDTNLESSSVRDVSSVLLKDFENLGEQLNLPEDMGQEEDGSRKSRSSTSSSTPGSRWKSMINSFARQVSQVPLSLAIKVGSLRGTLRLHVKPPPSDQLWYGFTSMPDIDFRLESSVGEHKITSGHVALFLINRLKASIRETIVLPNCESVCIPWMLAEKDDWVPQKVAPFIWLNQDAGDSNTVPDIQRKNRSEADKATSVEQTESKNKLSKSTESSEQPILDSEISNTQTLSPTSDNLTAKGVMEEMRTPLLDNDVPEETFQQKREDRDTPDQSPSRSVILFRQDDNNAEEDDTKPKRTGRRARMLDLGKKMGEKLDEKRRHIEEKSRHIVEKMRGP